ncbi:ATP-binding protein [Streptomyces aidingensis]|uniref:Anti-sigma regulatory factor (Ser/Thr protein kinase) n=1 Tax=Streptomyces aidingensis TaxID=910347 RepID=A0A1I1EE20_9ACTN|nr:ATP-binding protein [Streptomyces aidingensis]SFB85026.1 Anti-sigma regulatory factor (Ser/Thr protein kinase) [Streptomyces aidingensis]
MLSGDSAPPGREFVMRFTSTPRGARLARRLAAQRLDEWGVEDGSAAHDAMTLVVSELCSNAVRHGLVPGRDFRLRLTADGTRLRAEVTDARAEAAPATVAGGAEESGRGLRLVEHFAERWGWYPAGDGGVAGKTVWAECALTGTEAGR